MCGRFSFSNLLALIMRFKINLPQEVKPRYNIAPSQEVLALVNDGGVQAVCFRWGLIPFWAKNIGPGLINARAETVDKKPSFRQSLKSKRCLIPADGFYEWKEAGDRKRPYRITLKSEEVFSLAGLWDTWRSPEGETISSCTIITITANTLLKPIHNRMPVILSKKAEEVWLNKNTDLSMLKSLLAPYPAELMESYAISTRINNPRNDDPDVLKPLEEDA